MDYQPVQMPSHLDTESPSTHTSFYGNPSLIFWGCLGFMWMVYLWDSYLSLREYWTQKHAKEIPFRLRDSITKQEFEKSRSYTLDKSSFGIFMGAVSHIEATLILLFNGMPWLWRKSGYLVPGNWGPLGHQIIQTMIFLILAQVYQTISSFPFSYYKTFVIEERHGMNKQNFSFFIKDLVKSFVVFHLIIMNVVIPLLIYVIDIGGDYAFFYAWLFCVVVFLFISTIYQDYIAPIFDTFKPVPEGELRKKIEALANKLKFPLHRLYIIEGSKRSAHANAYFFGMFNKKTIVLFDTLFGPEYGKSKEKESASSTAEVVPEVAEGKIQTKGTDESKAESAVACSDDEIVAVLSHELGHWSLGHYWKNILISMITMLMSFGIFGMLYKNQAIYEAFGFRNETPIIIGLILILQYIYSPVNEVLNFGMITLSRIFEFQADNFAKKLNAAEALKEALLKLNRTNKSFPVHDRLYSMFNHSHPTLQERLEVLDKTE
ncbi:CAAX prenyl protease 1 homolog [Paramacrobiotus metropolitanus]|uniref:CAAX prenyl protease 1 homolog n=1 Tax=Paramacrobiotus metropolitanus TaxID=2943436 RepID=UPI002445D999|nr:CAAX prenyl protease 1 homolog [Paramacrobiotus metropolitanus]